MRTIILKVLSGFFAGTLFILSFPVTVQDGTLDTSFNTTGFVDTPITGFSNAGIFGIYIHYNGYISVCGNQKAITNPGYFLVTQYLPDGTVNPAFGNIQEGVAATLVADEDSEVFANAIAVQSDGKIVVAGYIFTTFGQIFVARLLPNGLPDLTFNIGGPLPGVLLVPTFSAGSSDLGKALVIDVNGNIVVVGSTIPESGPIVMAVARLTPAGVLDTTFNGTGQLTIDFGSDTGASQGFAVALQADGETIIAAGISDQTPDAIGQSNFAFAQISSAGAILLTQVTPFSTNPDELATIETTCNAVLVQPNGELVLVGNTSPWLDENHYFALARYQSDLTTLDPLFVGNQISHNPGTVVSPSIGSGIQEELSSALGAALQANGKIIVAGNGPNVTIDAVYENYMMSARYLGTNGNLDTTYNGGGPYSPTAPPGFVWTATNDVVSLYELRGVALQSPATDATNGYIVGGGVAGETPGSETVLCDFCTVRYVVDNPFVPMQVPVVTPPFFATGPVIINGLAQNPSIIDLFFDSITDTGYIGSTVTIGSTNDWTFTTTGPISGVHTAFAVGRYRDDGHVNLEGSATIGCPGFSPTSYYAELIGNIPGFGPL